MNQTYNSNFNQLIDFSQNFTSQDTGTKGNQDDAQKLGIPDHEYDLILKKLGREPSFTEICMFSGMWSEHCSYKNSILLLRKLYSKSKRMLAKPGEENAGALDIGDNKAVVFKMESHNHPSALEPYQGAATGVGGIMRDIFTMGARPLMSLNSLRFGNPQTTPRNRYLLREVVKGVGDYGNCLGVAVAAGELMFHEKFSKNPLVNAMTVGIAPADGMASNGNSEPGCAVVYVGASTGRDGIHGASFASKELSQESEDERSAIQVGDPFMEKLVMEATLEVIQTGLVMAIQDMGAAGLLSSSSEMSTSGNIGMDIFTNLVPARETGMLPFEYLLSESQERMLLVCQHENFDKVKSIFDKWKLNSQIIGVTTDSNRLRVFHDEKLYADILVEYLTVNSNGAPRYDRETKLPEVLKNQLEVKKFDFVDADVALSQDGSSPNITKKIASFFAMVNLADKKSLYEQYDTHIGINRVMGPGMNAGVHRVPDTNKALSVSSDCNSFYVAQNPYYGTQHAVAESIRNVVSSGATAIGITNCLNFANPHKLDNYYFFKNAVEGMSHACEFFEVPITGGNVSFYNESSDGPVLPTPTIGTVGLLENWQDTVVSFAKPNQNLYLIGNFKPSFDASQLAYFLDKEGQGKVPYIDLNEEKKSAQVIHDLLQQQKIKFSAIDLSLGGFLFALFRMLKHAQSESQLAANVDINELIIKVKHENNSVENYIDLALFGETAHCYIIASDDSNEEKVLATAKNHEVSCIKLGKTIIRDDLNLTIDDKLINLSLGKLIEANEKTLADVF